MMVLAVTHDASSVPIRVRAYGPTCNGVVVEISDPIAHRRIDTNPEQDGRKHSYHYMFRSPALLNRILK